MRLSHEKEKEIALAVLAFSSGSERSAEVARQAEHFGIPKGRVYGAARRHGGGSGRKRRSDAGRSKLDSAVLEKGFALLLQSERMTGDVLWNTPGVMEFMRDNLILENDVSESTFNRRLREERLSKKDIGRRTPHVTLHTHYPNEWWQFDSSNCVQYFLGKKAGAGLQQRDLETTFYKNKLGDIQKIKKVLLRYTMVDMFSGHIFCKYYYAAGETAKNFEKFLFEACSPKNDSRYVMEGVPENMYVDKGSANKAAMNLSLLDALGCGYETHMAGNPRAKGGVEKGGDLIQRGFESQLKLHAFTDLDALNRAVMDWCIYYNATKKFRGSQYTRRDLWLQNHGQEIRLCPSREIWQGLLRSSPETRLVHPGGFFSFNGPTYFFPDVDEYTKDIWVAANPYEKGQVRAWRITDPKTYLVPSGVDVHICEPLVRGADQKWISPASTFMGDYKARKETKIQKAKKRAEPFLEEFGVKAKGNKDKRRFQPKQPVDLLAKLREKAGEEVPVPVKDFQVGHQAAKVDNVRFLRPRGKEIPGMEANPVPKMMPILDAIRRLRQMFTGEYIQYHENQAIREKFGTEIEENRVDEVYEFVKGLRAGKPTVALVVNDENNKK